MNKIWTRQPQIAVGIDWSNPITLGLKAVFDQRYKREHITGTVASVDTATSAVGRFGRLNNYSGSANTRYPHHPNFAIIGDITIVALCEIRSLTNYTAIVAKQGTVSSAAPYELRLGGSSANRGEVDFIRAGASGFQEMRCAVDVVPTGFSGVLAFTRPTGTITDTTGNVFVNGNKSALSAAFGSGNGAATDNGTSDVWIGRRYDGVTQLDGKIYYVLLFNRVLNDFEIRSISQNPWQIFQPLPARIFVPMSAGSVSDLIISMTKANALATGVQAQILYDQLIQMLSASATTPSKSFNIDKTLDLLKANAQATGTQFNVDIAMLLAMAVANAQATGVKANIDKAINIQSGNSIASGGNILLDKAIGLAFANSNASGVKLNIDKTINTAVANAQASGITTLLDIVKNLVVGNAVANSNGFGSGSVLNLNSISGIATGTKVALDKVINQAVATATANAPKFNLDKSINTIVANALATGIITNLDRQILANSASAIATGITTILEYSTALAMNSGSASATGTTIRIDKQILISAGIANATGVDVSVVFAPFTYEPAFIIFSSETDLVVLDVVRGDIIVAPQQQMLQTLNPESRNNSFNVDSRGVISAPEQILQSLVSESRTNVFDSTTRISTFNRE